VGRRDRQAPGGGQIGAVVEKVADEGAPQVVGLDRERNTCLDSSSFEEVGDRLRREVAVFDLAALA
jgi:hypothetical protein